MTKRAPFLVTPLNAAAHDRSRFDCGTPALNRYLHEQVSQDIQRNLAACFVALDDAMRVAGFYTLSSARVPLLALPHDDRRKLPRNGHVPAVRVRHLAVDVTFKEQGLGGALLADALVRAARPELQAVLLLADAKNAHAVAFYRHYGFIRLMDTATSLLLPLATVRR